ncbi:hypothetical protein LOAG_19243, partial [Loa loa]
MGETSIASRTSVRFFTTMSHHMSNPTRLIGKLLPISRTRERPLTSVNPHMCTQ